MINLNSSGICSAFQQHTADGWCMINWSLFTKVTFFNRGFKGGTSTCLTAPNTKTGQIGRIASIQSKNPISLALFFVIYRQEVSTSRKYKTLTTFFSMGKLPRYRTFLIYYFSGQINKIPGMKSSFLVHSKIERIFGFIGPCNKNMTFCYK